MDKLVHLISVVIPTYKCRDGLKNAINSVLAQTYENIEIIVVDDNDPLSDERGKTEMILKTFADDPRIIYIKHDRNRNGAAARNTGIHRASGDIICFLDDDDAFVRDKLARQLSHLLASGTSAVYCDVVHYGLKRRKSRRLEGTLTKELLLLKTALYTPTLMLYKDVVKNLGGFDESFLRHQDFEFMLRFFHAGYTISYVNEALVVLGKNNGENIPSAERLESIKAEFLSRFDDCIRCIDKEENGFKNRVYSKHYSYVFLAYVKERHFSSAARIFRNFFPLSPFEFLGYLFDRARLRTVRRFQIFQSN